MTKPEALQDRRQILLEQLSRAADEMSWKCTVWGYQGTIQYQEVDKC